MRIRDLNLNQKLFDIRCGSTATVERLTGIAIENCIIPWQHGDAGPYPVLGHWLLAATDQDIEVTGFEIASDMDPFRLFELFIEKTSNTS